MQSVSTAFKPDRDDQPNKIMTQEANASAIAIFSDAGILNRLRDLEQPLVRVADQVALYTESPE